MAPEGIIISYHIYLLLLVIFIRKTTSNQFEHCIYIIQSIQSRGIHETESFDTFW